MIEDRDPLELELEAMTPRPLSSQVRQRIGRRLGRDARSGIAHWQWWGGLLAAAACVAIAILGWHLRPHGGFEIEPTGPSQPPQVVVATTPDPTVGAYQMALSQSPDRLDKLLEAHAARPMASDAPHWRAFTSVEQHPIP
jgi:hypothetical protein